MGFENTGDLGIFHGNWREHTSICRIYDFILFLISQM